MNELRTVTVTTTEYVDSPVYDEEKAYSMVDNPFIKDKRVSTKSRKIPKPLIYEGYFHQFSVMGDSGEYYAFAIIEDNAGRVREITATHIQFTDRSDITLERMTP